jgi:hypothetical protein
MTGWFTMKISKVILYATALTFGIQQYNSVHSMDHPDEAFMSPPPKAAPSAAVFPTPGEIVSKMQAEVLRKERFVAVLGVEVVDSWGFDWSMLEDPAVSFGDAHRISVMSSLHTKLQNLARKRYDVEFDKLHTEFLKLRERVFIVHMDRLETIAEHYFSSCFPGSNIEHDDKAGGVQLGTQVKIALKNGEKRKYHVKTHSAGRLSSKSSAAKPVNPQELMVYKVLERLGFGCETHFLQRSLEDVYIATLDAGHGGSFNVFEKATGALGKVGDEAYGQTLWGSLQIINPNSSLNDWNAIETVVQSDGVAQNFLLQIASLDMLSRILRLHDLLNNPDNFGFLETATAMPLLKVIDFRVADDTFFTVGPDNFGGFLIGNGLYNYIGSHRTMRYGLHDRPTEERVKAALHILTTGPLARSHEWIDLAYQDVRSYITSTEIFAAHVSDMMMQLDPFRDALHHNIAFFAESLQSWKPEESKKA